MPTSTTHYLSNLVQSFLASITRPLHSNQEEVNEVVQFLERSDQKTIDDKLSTTQRELRSLKKKCKSKKDCMNKKNKGGTKKKKMTVTVKKGGVVKRRAVKRKASVKSGGGLKTTEGNKNEVHYIINCHGEFVVEEESNCNKFPEMTNVKNERTGNVATVWKDKQKKKKEQYIQVPDKVHCHMYSPLGTCLMSNTPTIIGNNICNPKLENPLIHHTFLPGQYIPNFRLSAENAQDPFYATITRCGEQVGARIQMKHIDIMTFLEAFRIIEQDYISRKETRDVHIHCLFCTIIRRNKIISYPIDKEEWPEGLQIINGNFMDIDTDNSGNFHIYPQLHASNIEYGNQKDDNVWPIPIHN